MPKLVDARGLGRIGAPCQRRSHETCFDARDDDCNGLFDEGCGLGDGPFQLMVAWDLDWVDVELELVDPGGEAAIPGVATALGFLRDRDCPDALDGCGGQNIEVIYLERGPVPAGTYRVAIRLADPGQVTEIMNVSLGGHLEHWPVTGVFGLSAETPEVRFELTVEPP